MNRSRAAKLKAKSLEKIVKPDENRLFYFTLLPRALKQGPKIFDFVCVDAPVNVRAAKERSVIESLRNLAEKDNRPEIDVNGLISYYRERGAFTPKQLALAVWRFEVTQVPYRKEIFQNDCIAKAGKIAVCSNCPECGLKKFL